MLIYIYSRLIMIDQRLEVENNVYVCHLSFQTFASLYHHIFCQRRGVLYQAKCTLNYSFKDDDVVSNIDK